MEEVITSRQNARLVHLKKLLTSRSCRYEHRQYAADGIKLLEEAAKWDCGLDTVVLTEGLELPFPLPAAVTVLRVPGQLMRQISLMEEPQGALFLCRMPEPEPLRLQPGTLILDGIQDPGNLGTILRTADALNVPVILADGCADPYNPKTVRASMGAVFRTRPVQGTGEAVLQACRDGGIQLAATALSETATDIRATDLSHAAVVIGSEGRGVCRRFLEASERQIIIPMEARCESLNAAVAAAIVMWELRR